MHDLRGEIKLNPMKICLVFKSMVHVLKMALQPSKVKLTLHIELATALQEV